MGKRTQLQCQQERRRNYMKISNKGTSVTMVNDGLIVKSDKEITLTAGKEIKIRRMKGGKLYRVTIESDNLEMVDPEIKEEKSE